MPKLESLSYIFVAHTLGLSSVSLSIVLASRANAFGEMAQNNGKFIISSSSIIFSVA